MAKRKKNKIGHFFAFLIFLALGAASGYVGATYFLGSNNEDSPSSSNISEYPKDITNAKEFSKEIEQFGSFLNGNVYLYNSNGVTVDSVDNNIKLKLAYGYVSSNNLFIDEVINSYWYGAAYCENNFVVDKAEDGITNGLTCTLKVITKSNLLKGLNHYFKTDVVDYPSEFNPSNDIKCLLYEDDNYRCGKVDSTNISDGEIVNKFEVVKVTIDENNNIYYYDKGYLLDNRVGIEKNPNYEKAYLHSYDSGEYYYELKSSDNLTFKHTFKMGEDGEYYYYGSSVEEK